MQGRVRRTVSPGFDADNKAVYVERTGAVRYTGLSRAANIRPTCYSVQCWFKSTVPFGSNAVHTVLGRGNGPAFMTDTRDIVGVGGTYRRNIRGQTVFLRTGGRPVRLWQDRAGPRHLVSRGFRSRRRRDPRVSQRRTRNRGESRLGRRQRRSPHVRKSGRCGRAARVWHDRPRRRSGRLGSAVGFWKPCEACSRPPPKDVKQELHSRVMRCSTPIETTCRAMETWSLPPSH